jgi:hypothetical protein
LIEAADDCARRGDAGLPRYLELSLSLQTRGYKTPLRRAAKAVHARQETLDSISVMFISAVDAASCQGRPGSSWSNTPLQLVLAHLQGSGWSDIVFGTSRVVHSSESTLVDAIEAPIVTGSKLDTPSGLLPRWRACLASARWSACAANHTPGTAQYQFNITGKSFMLELHAVPQATRVPKADQRSAALRSPLPHPQRSSKTHPRYLRRRPVIRTPPNLQLPATSQSLLLESHLGSRLISHLTTTEYQSAQDALTSRTPRDQNTKSINFAV